MKNLDPEVQQFLHQIKDAILFFCILASFLTLSLTLIYLL